ncbi:hypothetical protein BDA96_04G143600 [Sorghum bicolor]|uniref:Glycosyltransferase 61 catalytic domain-containing protein n=3 Tax=Sorghum bicolor TaxID=4558 RepID=A0A921R4M7_SORBI|nr:hypothetical protein BDA96_04G143600 [Sorghum bicolor]OQU84859.1 hypothetical protein SORBI_3004G134100 [Sorghum bicolor]
MKAVERAKLVRSLRHESRRLRLLVLVIGFFLVTLTFVVVSKPDALLFNLNGRLLVDQAPRSLLIRQRVDAHDGRSADTLASASGDLKVVDDDTAGEEASTNAIGTSGEEERVLASEPEQSKRAVEATTSEILDAEFKPTLDVDQRNGRDRSHQAALDNVERDKPLCDFSNFRANTCEMRGNIRIHPNGSSVIYVEPTSSSPKRNEQWKIKPYPRKGDELCLNHITEVTVKSSKVAPECSKYHHVPAVIFALTGYTGNLFHDFTDVLVPLFTTASEFNGEVQFLITDMAIWWTRKYAVVFEKLTKYPLIDFNKDNEVHCFKHAIVGLHAYMEFTIDPLKAPHNYSMVDFNRFMRRTYSLPRDAVTALGEIPKTRPRLLIISRQRTRMFLNLKEIVAMADEIGYDVVVEEANVNSNVTHFAKVVNSVDVMMGVHGAGLTNCVFLPHDAILIQIVPWGALDGICRIDFGYPAEQMGLRYKHYSIGVHESSLTEQYPLDHEIFRNPLAFHKNGFEFVRQTFMDTQNVRLDCNRFRPILLEALDQLNQ